jgi:hypothetical protein
MEPLNTPSGQQTVENIIRDHCGGAIDLIVFDNVMALIAGDQKDEEGWRQTLPWIRSLTTRSIGQLWIHHTGHDPSHSYGTKTREWQMDTVISLEAVRRDDTDVSFQLSFQKARERTPANRVDFTDVNIALVGDLWTGTATASRQQKLSPNAEKFYHVLCRACSTTKFGRPAATIKDWFGGCFGAGLLDADRREEKATRSLFNKYKLELITKNWVSCDETEAWCLGPDMRGVF